MPSVKEYNVKLASLKNTRKMTRTMQMVSASKLRRAQNAQRSASFYAEQIRQLTARLAKSVGATTHPLLERREKVGKALLLVMTSDKGLCGGFNNNLCKFVERWAKENSGRFGQLDMSFCGRRGYMFFRRAVNVHTHYEGVTASPNFQQADRIARELSQLFIAGEYDEVYVASNTFKNALSQEPKLRKLLPVEPEFIEGGDPLPTDYIFEPPARELLEELLPKAVTFQVHFALLENAAGEHGARMTAMDNATTNADKLFSRYTLLRNRARQAQITTEMIEIVSGAEAI